MKKLSRWMIFVGIVLIFGMLTAFTLQQESASFEAGDASLWASFHKPDTAAEIGRLYKQNSPPAPNQNPCLHCHITGQEIGARTPLYRWLSFGFVGLIFLFGMTRSLTTWNTRQQWKPYHIRIVEMVNTSDPLGADVEKPAPKWLRNLWYALGVATILFFLPQIISGVINYYHLDPIVFDPEMDTHAQLILSIRNIHWALGTLLLVVMLGFNLIGSLLKSAERPFWTTMLIVGSVIGIPAIVLLTLGYLDPEKIIPTRQLYGAHAVLLSILLANIAALYFILTYKPSEE